MVCADGKPNFADSEWCRQELARLYDKLGKAKDANDRLLISGQLKAVPMMFEQFPPQPRNMEFVINCHAKFAGVSIYYPKAVCYLDGV